MWSSAKDITREMNQRENPIFNLDIVFLILHVALFCFISNPRRLQRNYCNCAIGLLITLFVALRHMRVTNFMHKVFLLVTSVRTATNNHIMHEVHHHCTNRDQKQVSICTESMDRDPTV